MSKDIPPTGCGITSGFFSSLSPPLSPEGSSFPGLGGLSVVAHRLPEVLRVRWSNLCRFLRPSLREHCNLKTAATTQATMNSALTTPVTTLIMGVNRNPPRGLSAGQQYLIKCRYLLYFIKMMLKYIIGMLCIKFDFISLKRNVSWWLI